MTAKECIKAKCADCYEGRGDCTFPDCPLFGLKRSVGGCNRGKAIRDYCRWCRNGLSMEACNSPSCSIYKYLNLGSKVATDAQIQEPTE